MNIEKFTQTLKELGCEKIYRTDKLTHTFLLVENENKAVLIVTIPLTEHEMTYKGIQLSSPIIPNLKTGSSVLVTEYDTYINEGDALKIISNWQQHLPNFFSREDREATEFQTIEQAVNQYGNILDYKIID